MPGAGKKRGKSDRKNQPAPEQDQPPQPSGGYDGAPSGPPSGPSSGRGRQESATGQSARSASRGPSASRGDAGQQPLRDPARDHPLVLNKNIDFAGNAYNLINQVSHRKCDDLTSFFFQFHEIPVCLSVELVCSPQLRCSRVLLLFAACLSSLAV